MPSLQTVDAVYDILSGETTLRWRGLEAQTVAVNRVGRLVGLADQALGDNPLPTPKN